ncbi:MAG TPA: hypothetical protein VN428_24535 [Bryobacteraceae bacterium]|nr:hypothetical protein [Bryobacteraceae bacterium]
MVSLLTTVLAAQLVPIKGELRPYRTEQVYSSETGFVERVRAGKGDRVAGGQLLADIFRDIGEKPHEVRAPFAGVVAECFIVTGARVGPGMKRHATPLFEIIETERLRIVAVAPYELPAGRSIAFRSGQRKGTGILERTVMRAGLRFAEVSVENQAGLLAPGDPVELLWPQPAPH